ncbi:MAG TPA: CDP-glycerol glycerophosphotransferase family protein [Nocardioides sp.]|uniref:bifunctional glycosyltransferase/CDP-glycerol:glycerophosphate glycerophosphotransferase n=1 Tax=Nocardioides sp. TaxID=35761 RepID=UPI002E2F42A4|nr:CDP-glycerol glycerophosphotransferase family protein [Nocardioides sp.]HEX3929501.1 CDP-glycerol glycerophosphotransferase family protein [Nocardioides sp.]
MQNRLTRPARLSNAPLDRVRRLARTAPERARRASDGARIRARRALHRRGYVPGLLSIVVPCYQVEDFLDECLVSLRFQSYREVEIIVVDDGSPDRSGEIARRHARRDLRVRVVTRENGGLSAARNTGIDHARGEFLTFVDSDDVVTPEAYTSAIEALSESGSDFVLSCYDRLEGVRRVPAGTWIRAAHARRRLGVDLDSYPEAMVNAVAWSKTYRRGFWDRAGLRFPEGRIYEDQPVSAAAFARARAFDVVPEISVSWRIRNDRSSISQSAWSSRNLAAHSDSVAASFEALREAGKERAVQIRALQLISFNMTFFTRHLVKGGEEFWSLLREAVLDLVGRVSREEFVHSVGAQDKVLVELIAGGRRDAAVEYIENWGGDPKRFATRRSPEGIRVELPLTEGLPDDVTILSDAQLELVSRLMRVVWKDDELTVAGWSYIRNIDLEANPPEALLELVSADGATRIPLETELYDEPRVDVLAVHWHCNYRLGGWRAKVPVDQIPADREQEWSLEVTMTAAGVRRTSRLRDISMAGSSSVQQTQVSPGGVAHTVQRGDERQSVVRVVHHPTYAVSQEVSAEGTATIVFRAGSPDRVVVNHIDSERRELLTATPEPTGHDGEWRVRLDLAALPTPRSNTTSYGAVTRPLRIRVRQRDGRWTPLLAPPSTDTSPAVVAGPGRPRRLTRGKGGELEVMDLVPVATSYALTDETLTVQVHATGNLSAYTPTLSSLDLEVPGEMRRERDGAYTLTFPLVGPRWGYDGLALPRNRYGVLLRAAGDDREQDLPITPSSPLLDRLPADEHTTLFRSLVEVVANRPPMLTLNVQEPLADDVRGQRNQFRLRNQAKVEEATADSVFFRALYSEVANCNMLGVHHELGRRGSSLTRYWSVRDRSVPVPEGGIGLVEGTPEWHEALATSRYVMVNVHQPEWYEKPRGQVLIQTMHGYPYKVMGHEWWEKGGFPAGQINSFDRRARAWDYFVSPATYATPLLRAAFLDPAGATPKILEIGYPRNDILQSDEAPTIRDRVRKVLGIADGQRVVMYAPTFRDYMSADDMAAERIDFFDVDRAARELGPSYTFLVRGHAFNARAGGRHEGGAHIVDVTGHPDINDLILASDAAVLDYSSLRFDYALVDRPMIFLVPDLEKYDAVRGGVIPFGPTAPGPQVATTREVIALVRDLAGLTRRTAAARATFRRDYADLDDGHASARLVDAVFRPR